MIIDEAHNLEKMAREAASFDLTAEDMGSAYEEGQAALLIIMNHKEAFGELW